MNREAQKAAYMIVKWLAAPASTQNAVRESRTCQEWMGFSRPKMMPRP
jgi:hypothetical protein